MKINENNLRNVENLYADEATFTYDDISTMIAEPEAPARANIVKAHPAIAASLAVAFIAAPVAGITVTNLMSNAAELPAQVEDAELEATFVNAEETEETPEMTETTFIVAAKTLEIAIEGPGHIEAVDSCSIEDGKVVFEDAKHDASIKMVGDVDGAAAEFKLGDEVVARDGDVIVLKATEDYADAKAVFTDVVAQQKEAEEAARQEEEAARAAEEAAKADPVYTAPTLEPVYEAPAPEPVYEAPAPEPVYEAPAPEPVYEAPAPAPAAEPVYEAPASSLPFSGMPQNEMLPEERALAEEIFNAYNDLRASKGLNRVAWSEDCANMAWGSATGCAAKSDLIHRLGIPAAVQMNYSDILQYSTWKKTASEAVAAWEKSGGHRRMMQCNTAQSAGVAVYNDYGTWFYVIVYNFQGCNQSGN